jgi:hypothetical protein
MLKNKNILLLITIIALALIVWGLSRQGSLNEQTKSPRLRFSSKVDKIEINQKESTIVLIKQDDNWFVRNKEVNYPANASAMEDITAVLGDFKIKEIVSQNPKKYVDFQVDDESALQVRWFKGDKELSQLFLGKSDYARGGNYVRIGEGKAVYITQGNVKFNFSRPEFRDLTVLKIEQDKIKQIAWNYGKEEENFMLVKKKVAVKEPNKKTGSSNQTDTDEEASDNTNTVQETENPTQEKWFVGGTEDQIDDSKINSLLSKISNINAKDILPKKEETDYGFSNPYVQITISAQDQDYILTLGNQAPSLASDTGQADEEPAYYSQTFGKEEWVYLLDIAFVNDNLAKKAKDFAADKGEE